MGGVDDWFDHAWEAMSGENEIRRSLGFFADHTQPAQHTAHSERCIVHSEGSAIYGGRNLYSSRCRSDSISPFFMQQNQLCY